jgi:hypothetical protein
MMFETKKNKGERNKEKIEQHEYYQNNFIMIKFTC